MAYNPYPTYRQLLGSGLRNPRNIGVSNLSPRLQTSVLSAAYGPSPIPVGAAAAASGPAPPPGYGDLLNQLLAGLGGSQGGISPDEGIAQARRAIIQYGAAPAGMHLSNLGGAFDSATQKLAQENTQAGISLLARINQAHTDQNLYIKNRLAAHGILDSGETGYQVGREQTNYARAQADSTSKLLDYLSGINAGIAQYKQWQAMMDAIRNAMSGNYGGPTGSAVSTDGSYTGPNYGGVIPTGQSQAAGVLLSGQGGWNPNPRLPRRSSGGAGRRYAF